MDLAQLEAKHADVKCRLEGLLTQGPQNIPQQKMLAAELADIEIAACMAVLGNTFSQLFGGKK